MNSILQNKDQLLHHPLIICNCVSLNNLYHVLQKEVILYSKLNKEHSKKDKPQFYAVLKLTQEFDLQLLSVQDEKLTVSQSLTDPVGSQTVTINQSDMLQLDADGGLLMVVQAVAGKDQTEKGKRAKKYTWHIKDLSVELRGQRLAP